jgi:hypothetical protein
VNSVFPINVIISPGNYTGPTFVTALTAALTNVNITPATGVPPITFNQASGLITLNLYGATAIVLGNTYIIDDTTLLTFFDPTGALACCDTSTCCSSNNNQQLAINQTLGWIMGYRIPSVLVDLLGNTASAVANFSGPKYLILVIDDYNQNHINSGLVGITEYSNTLKLPSYYSPSIPYFCTPANPNINNLKFNSAVLANDINAGTLLMDKLNTNYKSSVTILPSAPRTLTQSQIYTINEIMKNNDKSTNFKLMAPTTSDTFAILPAKVGGMTTGEIYVEFSSSLQVNKRVYFGPVNISRLRIRLLDDKGNNLNLHGADWVVTLLSENLYQY